MIMRRGCLELCQHLKPSIRTLTPFIQGLGIALKVYPFNPTHINPFMKLTTFSVM